MLANQTILRDVIRRVPGGVAPLSERLRHLDQLLGWSDTKHGLLLETTTTKARSLATPIKVGDPFTDFALPTDTGKIAMRVGPLGKCPCIVSVVSGHWCPFSLAELIALADVYETLATLGIEVVAIMPDVQVFTRRMRSEWLLPFTIMSDIDCEICASLDQTLDVNQRLRDALLEADIDLQKCQNGEGTKLPRPSLFVLDREGQICLHHEGKDQFERLDPHDLVEQVPRLLNLTT